MSATANSMPGSGRVAQRVFPVRAQLRTWKLGLWALLLAGRAASVGEPVAPAAVSEVARVERLFVQARQNLASAPTNVAFAWQFGRACFDRAEFATNNTERALIADQGIAACRRALLRKMDSAPAHYYLAMNLGQLARTKSLGALKLVDQMETEFKAARQLDERFDFAGPDRNLGLLYLEAPGWPTSIGSRTKARQHLRRAVELAPEHPENRLCLLEAYLRWRDRNGASRELHEVEAIWPVATTNLVGEAWTAAWTDWQARLKRARLALAEGFKPEASLHRRKQPPSQ